jgi:hypothetical protein
MMKSSHTLVSNRHDSIDSSDCQRENVDEQEVVGGSSDKKASKIGDTRFQEAIQRLLRLDMGIIPMDIIHRRIDVDAANVLVEHGIFIYLSNLFAESDDWEPDGFFKEMSENVNSDLFYRLARFGVSSQVWQTTAGLPDTWKSRLSPHGIRMLRRMPIYGNQLESLWKGVAESEKPEGWSDDDEVESNSTGSASRLSNKRGRTGKTPGDSPFVSLHD